MYYHCCVNIVVIYASKIIFSTLKSASQDLRIHLTLPAYTAVHYITSSTYQYVHSDFCEYYCTLHIKRIEHHDMHHEVPLHIPYQNDCAKCYRYKEIYGNTKPSWLLLFLKQLYCFSNDTHLNLSPLIHTVFTAKYL